jgi:hypothetical protein
MENSACHRTSENSFDAAHHKSPHDQSTSHIHRCVRSLNELNVSDISCACDRHRPCLVLLGMATLAAVFDFDFDFLFVSQRLTRFVDCRYPSIDRSFAGSRVLPHLLHNVRNSRVKAMKCSLLMRFKSNTRRYEGKLSLTRIDTRYVSLVYLC